MRSKSSLSNLALAVVAVVAFGIVAGVRVQSQAPFLIFGSSSGTAQQIKATGNALWVSLQSATSFAGVTCVGKCLPIIVADTRVTGQTAAVSSVATYTVGASDGTFEVAGIVTITTSTTYSFFMQCTYTSEDNVQHTVVLDFVNQTTQYVVTIANTVAQTSYAGRPMTIRAKSGTSITVLTQAAGTYTTVVYNAEGIIKQIS